MWHVFLPDFAVFVKLTSCSAEINTPSTAVCLSRALNFPAGFSAALVPAKIWLVKLWVAGKWGETKKGLMAESTKANHVMNFCCYSCPRLSLSSSGKSLPQNWIQGWPWIAPCFSVSYVFSPLPFTVRRDSLMLFLLQSLFSSCYGHEQPEKQGSQEPEKNVADDSLAQGFKGINQLSWLIDHTGSDTKFRSRTSSLTANSWNLVKAHIFLQDYLSVSRLVRNLQSI